MMAAGRFETRTATGGLLPLAGVVSVTLPAIDRECAQSKRTTGAKNPRLTGVV